MKKRIILFALFLTFSSRFLHAQGSTPSAFSQPCLTDGECQSNPKPTVTLHPPDPIPTPVLQHGVLWISPNTASGTFKTPGSTSSAFSQPCLQDSADGDCGDPPPPPPPPPPQPHLNYFGGPVISNVQVVEVLYGSGSFLPQVSSTTTPSIASFFNDILGANSGYINLLTQYNTPASGGTNQTIGNGTFYGLFQIVPSAANNGSTITDTQIQAELLAQISAGHLPSPILDAAGNVNTLYMIYFPPGQKITLGQLSSCVSGGFCAYHGTTSNTLNSRHLLYGVLPDMQAGSGCDVGCGPSTTFGNYTSVTSHELTEAITDADVGLVTTPVFPVAWYDVNYGEIGDICNLQQGSYQANGTTYTIQLEFSNAAGECVLPPPAPAPSFSLSSAPASLTMNQGASGSSTITVTAASGFTGSVNLSASGLPSGATANFSPTSVAGSGTSALTITTTNATPAGNYSLTITGTSGGIVHSTSVNLSVQGFTLSVTPGSLTVNQGDPATFTATVTYQNGFSGTVQLCEGNGVVGSCRFNPNTLTSSGSSVLTIPTSTLPLGSSTILVTATSGNLSQSQQVSLTVTNFRLAITPSSQTISAGTNTTYQVTLTLSTGFSGSVSLSATGLPSGATPVFSAASISSSGSSTLTISTTNSLASGTYPFTISGASGSLSTSVTATLVVTAPVGDFTLSASPSSQTINAGDSTGINVAVSALSGFTGNVSLDVSGLPGDAFASFSPASINGSGSSLLSISSGTSTGSFFVTITGTSGSLSHSATVQLNINAPPDPCGGGLGGRGTQPCLQ